MRDKITQRFYVAKYDEMTLRDAIELMEKHEDGIFDGDRRVMLAL